MRAPIRIALPSGWNALAGLPLAAALLASLSQLQADGDYWWHVTVGQWILQHGDVPHHDLISWLADKPNWVSQEWLAEVAMALTAGFGPLGSVWLFAAVTLGIWALFVSLCRATLREDATPLTVSLLALATAVVALPIWAPRLQLLIMLWGLAVVRITFGFLVNGERRGIWLLPVIAVLWANTHLGSAILAVLLVGGLVVGDAIERHALPPRVFWIVAGLSLVALLLNPYTTSVYTFAFQTVFSPAAQGTIQEWASPNFHSLAFRGLQVLIVALLILLPFGSRRLEFRGLLVAAGLLFMTLQSGRYIGPFAVIALPLLAPALVDGVRTLLARAKYTPAPFLPLTTNILRTLSVLSLVAAVALLGVRMTDRTAQDKLTHDTQPVAAAAALAPYLTAHPSAHVMAAYAWGGYLYEEHGIEAGLYGASEAFTDDLFNRAWQASVLRDDPAPFLSQYHVDVVLIEPDAPLARWLHAQPDWRQFYADDQAVVFVHN